MRLFGVVTGCLVALWASEAARAAESCPGWKSPATTKIVNGTRANLQLWPSLAALRLTSPNGKDVRYICGGSAIAKDVVMTAAHCFDEIEATPAGKLVSTDDETKGWTLDVVLGVDDLERATAANAYPAVRRKVHEDYTPQQATTRGQDIALVWLGRPWTGPLANLSLDPTGDPAVPPGASVAVAGFGLTLGLPSGGKLEKARKPTGVRLSAGSLKLLHVDLPLVATPACATRWQGTAISGGQICAGYDSPNVRKDSCGGDSGGPLNVYDSRGCPRQVGLVSWGAEDCGAAATYGVYTRISHHARWLQANVPQLAPGPGSGDIARDDLTAAAFLEQINSLFEGQGGKLGLALSGGPVVKVGGKYTFQVRSDTGGRLIIIDVDAAGVATQIFPNEFVADGSKSLIRAGETVAVPGPGYNFDHFRATPPLGKGRLIALVVPTDFAVEHVIAAPVRSKGFVAERSATGYFLNLLHQIAGAIGLARGGGSAQTSKRWAVTSTEYEIVN